MNSRVTLRQRLEQPVDIAPLVYFRIIFGAIMIWEVYRYFTKGWITKYFVEPVYLSKYYLFEWVHPLPADGMYALFVLLALSAFCIMLGLWYRIATVIFFVGFTYMFFLDASRYLNHFYLVSLILFQLGVAYFFAGVAKITPDWLQGEPIGQWLRDRADTPIIGGFFTTMWAGHFFAYGGLLLDLFIVPLLLIRKTRPYAFAVAVSFHVLNAILFTIGIFPWFMLGATLIFFPAHHFRKWLTKFGILSSGSSRANAESSYHLRLAAYAGIIVFAAWQILMPLRHFLYASNPSWSDEGHRFSWHMKLRDKDADFRLVARAGDSTWFINPKRILRSHQYSAVAATPDLLVHFAQYVGADFEKAGHQNVQINTRAFASLNGRQSQLLIDTAQDLMRIKRSLAAASWIEPLREPLPPLEERHSLGQDE